VGTRLITPLRFLPRDSAIPPAIPISAAPPANAGPFAFSAIDLPGELAWLWARERDADCGLLVDLGDRELAAPLPWREVLDELRLWLRAFCEPLFRLRELEAPVR
jgi:hypothetical protein